MSGLGPRTANTYSTGAPAGYVAGVGRGALGFTTRSDIGPAKPAAATIDALGSTGAGQPPAGYVAGRGRGMGDLARSNEEVGPQIQASDRADYSESNYDEFSGYGGDSLAFDTPYDQEDLEADRIYEAIDYRMDSRRKRRREEKQQEISKANRNNRPKIGDQFADLKRELSSVTADQWESIPDVIGDHSLGGQKKRAEIYTPVPDFILDNKKGALNNSIDAAPGMSSIISGSGSSGMQSVLNTGLSEARGSALSSKLDKMSDSVTGQTVIDPKGYMTGLNSIKVSSEAEIGDIKKARTLLHSVTSTNPKHAPGWIAAALVEEHAGKLVAARKIIREGCEICPDNEDIWLEAARLHSNENAKIILANAVKHLPNSVKIWLKAADLEGVGGAKDGSASTAEMRKKVVLRRALEFIPNSVQLWKSAIELENVTDARIMLARAVECVPHSVEMWLALAKIETYENARRVLNQAREAIPTEPSIWITAAKLEEAHNPKSTSTIFHRIIDKALSSLQQHQVVIDRDYWLKEAEVAEEMECFLTCEAIVKKTIHYGIDEEDRLRVWADDAEACLSNQKVVVDSNGTETTSPAPRIHTARCIYRHALEVSPTNESLWMDRVMMEKEYGSRETLDQTLKEAVKMCPHAEILWLMAAKEKWQTDKDVPGARAILLEAFGSNRNSEQIWLAAVKLEWENDELERARLLLSKARGQAPTAKIWMKSALLEREIHFLEEKQLESSTGVKPESEVYAKSELEMLDNAIAAYPSFTKFYLMAAHVCDVLLHSREKAKAYYIAGIQHCSNSENEFYDQQLMLQLWIHLTRLEEKYSGIVKARSIIEKAKLRCGNNQDVLWLECVQLERRHLSSNNNGGEKHVATLMAQALQECPNSGILWAEDVLTCPKAQQKSKSMDALKKCDNNPSVILAIARYFERDGKIVKARRWFERALALDPKVGDTYIYLYRFEMEQKRVLLRIQQQQSATADASAPPGPDYVSEVLRACESVVPNRGALWCSIAKKTENRRCSIASILNKAVKHVEELENKNKNH